MTRVGLIGPADREELIRLSIRIEERSAEAVILDSRKEPAVRLAPGRESAYGVDLTGFSAFYVADLGLPSPVVRRDDGTVDIEGSAEALDHSRRHLAVWNALLARLAMRCPVVNPVQTHDIHAIKPWEVSAYIQRGLPVPETIATSDAEALVHMPAAPPDGWIRKGMVGGYDYTEEYTPPDSIEQAGELLRFGSAMVQERIMGENLRAFVLDGEMIGAAEVITRAGTEIDSRRGNIRVRRVELPDDAARAAVAAAERWGMIFAAVDFMVEARTGRSVILECNSAPFFVNFERATGLPISSRLAEFLARRRRGA